VIFFGNHPVQPVSDGEKAHFRAGGVLHFKIISHARTKRAFVFYEQILVTDF